MNEKRKTPERWLRLMEPFGMDSAQQLAAKAGPSVQTIIRMFHGPGETSQGTLDLVAKALRVDVAVLHALRGEPARRRFELPADAELLSDFQRETVRRVIRSMTPAARVESVTVGEITVHFGGLPEDVTPEELDRLRGQAEAFLEDLIPEVSKTTRKDNR